MQGSVPGGVATPPSQQFDLLDQAQVVALLNHVRRKVTDPDQQNQVRNLILDYTTTQNPDFLEILSNSLRPYGIGLVTKNTEASVPVPEAVMQSNEPAPKINTAVLGTTRRTPSFSPSISVTNASSTPIETETTPEITPAPEPDNKVTQPEPVINTPAPEPAAAPVVAPPVPPPAPTPEPIAPASDHLARIKEIKRIVNEQVGNPVNLIDADNAVGREYMNALLDAMKKVHGGEKSEVEAAMQRLEAAYQSVETTLKEKSVATAVTPPMAPTTPSPAPIPEPTPAVAEITPVESVEPTPAIQEEPAAATNPPAAETAVSSNPSALASLHEELTNPAPEPVAPPPTPEPEPTPISPAPVTEVVPPITNQATPEASKPAETTPAPQAASTAPDPVVETPTPEPATPTDPLHTPQIEAGLDQLLSKDWSLFQSSGIFGTGPSGREHPLYKSLATLPMAAIVSGRFEGSTPETKVAITDYMNGWRYEYSVVHEMDETFEHYLRRVIAAILDKRAPAA